MKKLDLIGIKFGRLTVVSTTFSETNVLCLWNCVCECGGKKIVSTRHLRLGKVRSCGCLNNEKRAERAFEMSKKNTKYDPSISTARRVWHRGYPDMLFEDFLTLSQQNCFYCNVPPNNIANTAKNDMKSAALTKTLADFKYNGLDRVDNTKPHSKENCVPCCKWCNYSKRERTTEEFKSWIIELNNHFILGNE